MIRAFGSQDTERIWHEQYVKRIDHTVQLATSRKLELIHAAKDVDDLRIPPGNLSERLAGPSPAAQHSGEHAVADLLRLQREVRTMSNWSTTTEAELIEPIHPGEVLMEDFIESFGITADTAIRLARYFGTSEEFWMNLQSNYELRLQCRVLGEKIAGITPLKVA